MDRWIDGWVDGLVDATPARVRTCSIYNIKQKYVTVGPDMSLHNLVQIFFVINLPIY